MNHLNVWGGHSSTDSYETYDYVQCPSCKTKAIEYYRTEFIVDLWVKPEFKLVWIPEDQKTEHMSPIDDPSFTVDDLPF